MQWNTSTFWNCFDTKSESSLEDIQTLSLLLFLLFFFFTHTHCILFLQEINRLTPSIVHGWPQQKQQCVVVSFYEQWKKSLKNFQWGVSFRSDIYINIIFPSNLCLWLCPPETYIISSKYFKIILFVPKGLWVGSGSIRAGQTHGHLYRDLTEFSLWGWL